MFVKFLIVKDVDYPSKFGHHFKIQVRYTNVCSWTLGVLYYMKIIKFMIFERIGT